MTQHFLSADDQRYLVGYAYGYNDISIPYYNFWCDQGYQDGVGDREEGILPCADFDCTLHVQRPVGTYVTLVRDCINPSRTHLPAETPSKVYVIGFYENGGLANRTADVFKLVADVLKWETVVKRS